MSWSIQQIARMSGVTARTLRYYDAIGLLRPARVGANGYRFYEYEQLLRLQHILLLRELGMDLSSVASIVDGDSDRLETLRAHLERLRSQRDQLDALIQTVSATIAHMEKGLPMPAEEMFDGFHFDRDTIDELEALARDRSGHEQPYFDELRNRTAGWTEEQFRLAEQAGAETERRLLALLRAGAAPDDPAVFAVLDDDVAAQRRLLPLNAEEYGKLGRAFVAAPELRDHLDARDPNLAQFMCDAMVAYASARMT